MTIDVENANNGIPLGKATIGGEGGSGTDATAIHFQGSVATYADLPTDAQQGDMYDVQDTGKNYAWTGSEWDDLGGNIEVDAYTKAETNVLLREKQDTLTVKSPIGLEAVPDERLIGFEINNTNNQAQAVASQKTLMLFGGAQENIIYIQRVTSYIKIPYTLGQILRLPFLPTSSYSVGYNANGTAMTPGWFGHTNEDGSVSPVLTVALRSRIGNTSYDTPNSYLYYDFYLTTSKYTGEPQYKASHSKTASEISDVDRGDERKGAVYIQCWPDDNSLTVQYPAGGFAYADKGTTMWGSAFSSIDYASYDSIDCFIYCPPGQEYIDTTLFGVYESENKKGAEMITYVEDENPADLFSLEAADIHYLLLKTGDGLTTSDGKLTANFATQEQALEGTDDSTVMTPLKVSQKVAQEAGRGVQLSFNGTLSDNTITFSLPDGESKYTIQHGFNYEVDLYYESDEAPADDVTLVVDNDGDTIKINNVLNTDTTTSCTAAQVSQIIYKTDTGYRWIFPAKFSVTSAGDCVFTMVSTVANAYSKADIDDKEANINNAIVKKQDKLSPVEPVTISTYTKSNLEGFTYTDSNTAVTPTTGAYTSPAGYKSGSVIRLTLTNYKDYWYEEDGLVKMRSYIDIPYSFGQVIALPTSSSSTTAWTGYWGKTLKSGQFIPIVVQTGYGVEFTGNGVTGGDDLRLSTETGSTPFPHMSAKSWAEYATGSVKVMALENDIILMQFAVEDDGLSVHYAGGGTSSSGIYRVTRNNVGVTIQDSDLSARLQEITTLRLVPSAAANHGITGIGLYDVGDALLENATSYADILGENPVNLFDITDVTTNTYLELGVGTGLTVTDSKLTADFSVVPKYSALTQDEYDALETKDDNTIYLITE